MAAAAVTALLSDGKPFLCADEDPRPLLYNARQDVQVLHLYEKIRRDNAFQLRYEHGLHHVRSSRRNLIEFI